MSENETKNPLANFLVVFKGYRQFKINSQDDATAHKWAEKQMEVWGKTYKVSITPVLIKETKETTEETKEVEKKVVKNKK